MEGKEGGGDRSDVSKGGSKEGREEERNVISGEDGVGVVWSPLTPRHIFHLTSRCRRRLPAAAEAAAASPRSWLALIVMLFGPYAIIR